MTLNNERWQEHRRNADHCIRIPPISSKIRHTFAVNCVRHAELSLGSWRDSRPSVRALFMANGRDREPRSREGIGASCEGIRKASPLTHAGFPRIFSRPALIPPAPATNPASYTNPASRTIPAATLILPATQAMLNCQHHSYCPGY